MALLKSTTARQTEMPIDAPIANGKDHDTIIADLQAQIAKLKAARNASLVMKVSAKGALSVYGLQRWPITLYREQWDRLLKAAPDIEAFIEANGDRLSVKPPKGE